MTLHWAEQVPDTRVESIARMAAGASFLDTLALLAQVAHGPRVWVTPQCRAGIERHLQSGATEMGGLLVGRAFEPDEPCLLGWGPLVSVEDHVPSREFKSSAVSLAMGTEVWDGVRAMTGSNGRMVVGWYHSHPGLGAFFSGTDRRTQRHFFRQTFSVGLVVDPIRGEEAWFVGAQANQLNPKAVLPACLSSLSPANAGGTGEAR